MYQTPINIFSCIDLAIESFVYNQHKKNLLTRHDTKERHIPIVVRWPGTRIMALQEVRRVNPLQPETTGSG